MPSLEHLLEGDDLAGELWRAGQHDVERLVEHDLGAPVQVVGPSVGMHRDPHLAAAGEHVDGAVVVDAEQGAVGRRRLGELLDLFAQRGDVLARLAQGVGELLVLARRPGPAGPWSRAAAPRGCAPAWARPAGAAAGEMTSSSSALACSRSSASSASWRTSACRSYSASLTGTTSSLVCCGPYTGRLRRSDGVDRRFRVLPMALGTTVDRPVADPRRDTRRCRARSGHRGVPARRTSRPTLSTEFPCLLAGVRLHSHQR